MITSIMIFALTWILTGMIAVILGVRLDLKGKPYDPNYFDISLIFTSILVLILGYISFILISIYTVYSLMDKEKASRWLYDLVNGKEK